MSIRSQNADQPTNVTFKNVSPSTVRLFWHSYEGELEEYAVLNPGETYDVDTFVTHPWSAVDVNSGSRVPINNGNEFYPRPQNETVYIGQYMGGGYQQQPQGQYYQNQYQQYQQPSQHYGGYGGYFQQNVFSVQAWQAFQFQSPDELNHVFHAEMQRNPVNAQRQAIQAEDLCNIMNNCQTIRNHFRITWSRELCSIMLAMLDRSGDGFMQWQEFLELQQCLVQWHQVFMQYDHDRSGYIEANELVNIVTNLFKYNLSPQSIETVLKRYSRVIMGPGGPRCLIAFDDFVSVSVRLRAYTDAYRKRDQLQHGGDTGTCTFQYDDFIRCVMCL